METKEGYSLKNSIKERIWTEWKQIDWIIYKNCKIVHFEWKEYIISNNAVLTIQLTEICNANCSFCFNWITFYPLWSNKNDGLDRILDFCKVSEIENVGISWWEPTVNISNLINLET